jgi:hypothetical protein
MGQGNSAGAIYQAMNTDTLNLFGAMWIKVMNGPGQLKSSEFQNQQFRKKPSGSQQEFGPEY